MTMVIVAVACIVFAVILAAGLMPRDIRERERRNARERRRP